jgi:dienelactone hydrolase
MNTVAARSMRIGGWVLGVVVVAQLSPAAAGRQVTFLSPAGRQLSGLMFDSSLRPAPAVVLVPMLGGSKEDWEEAGQRLADARIMALAIDLPQRTHPGDAAALASWHLDVRAALDYLSGRPDVRSLGLAGASLGANLAVLAAVDDSRVRSLALVSPSLDYRGVRIEAPMQKYGARPALLLASLRDPYAARSVRELVKNAPGPRDARWAESAAHGTVLLDREPDLVRALVEWFQRTLTVN